MNRKGITLVEVIISVALIALVMLFLFNLLNDMEFEEAHPAFSKENQQNRAIIMKTVQEDFISKKLKDGGVTLSVAGTEPRTILFQYESGEVTMSIRSKSISYQGETWNIPSSEDVTYDVNNIQVEYSKTSVSQERTCDVNHTNCSNYFYYRIVIPVKNASKANSIDDIEFFYIGQKN